MSYQFIHLEAYSRKSDKSGRNVNWVLDEAERAPGSTPHVENPELPKLIFGCSISQLRTMHDDACSDAKTTNKNGIEKSIRVDQKTLMTIVGSHHFTPADLDDVDKRVEYEKWEHDTIKWLKEQYGPNLKTVIRHQDEAYLHIHAYVLPSDLKALELHPGVAAKRQAKADALSVGKYGKAANKEGDNAYKSAMRKWQDSYFENVAIRHGLARLGPAKRRLSREAWKQEQAQAQALKMSLDRAAKLARDGRAYADGIKKKASAIVSAANDKTDEAKAIYSAAIKKEKAAVDLVEQTQSRVEKINLLDQRARQTHQNAEKKMQKAQSDAKAILSDAQKQARKMISIGSFIRSFFDGFKKSRIRKEIESAAQQKIEQANNEARRARIEMFDERKQRRAAETKASNASMSARQIGAELRDARDQLARMKPNNRKPAQNNVMKR